jgi:hypothetical protein
MMPAVAPKLSRNPSENISHGWIIRMTLPDRYSALNGEHLFPVIRNNAIIQNMIHARNSETGAQVA